MNSYRNNGGRAGRIATAVGALSLVLSAQGSDDYPVFRHIGMLDGLPDPSVEAIVQDRYGYVWIGTQGGLIRHEGDRLNLLPRDPSDPGALPDNNIMALHAHSDGMVWAALEDHGVVEIGPDLTLRRHLAPQGHGGPLPFSDIWSMAEDCDGRLWMAFSQGGVGVYDSGSEDYQFFPQDESAGLHPDGFQSQLLIDPDCRVWLVQTTQISVFDPTGAADGFTPVLVARRGLGQFFIHAWVSPQGELLASRGGDLLSLGAFDRATSGLAPEVLRSAPAPILSIGGLPDGRVFMATHGGLEVFNRATGAGRTITAQRDLPFSLPASKLSGANLVDHEGGLWLAVANEGLVYLPPSHAAFARLPRRSDDGNRLLSERIQSVSRAFESDTVWVASETGPYQLNVSSGRYTRLQELFTNSGMAGLNTAIVPQILETGADLLVLQLQSLTRLRNQPDEFESLISSSEVMPDTFDFIHKADGGRFWLGTRSGALRLFDPADRSFLDFSGLAPVAMQTGPQDQLWLAGQNAIFRYNAMDGFSVMAEPSEGPLRSLAWDGWTLWAGSDHALYQYRLVGDELSSVRRLDLTGLTERTTLLEILPSREPARELWLVLRSGVARLDLETERLRSYSRSNGLALSEFSANAAVSLDDGTIVLGGAQGIVTIDPARLRREPIEPPVYLRAVSAGDRRISVSPGQRAPVDLAWDQNSVRFEFSALTFVAPDQVRYRVRLQGWDNEWLPLDRQSSLYYSNLPSGRYRFEVQAASPEGQWGANGDRLEIRIASAPWASPLAWLAYAVLAFVLAGFSWRQYSRARRRRRELHDIRHKRKLAEGQRHLIQRLNADLDPVPLAHSIAAEIQRLTATKSAVIGYLHELMPIELVSGDAIATLRRAEWLERLDAADGVSEQAVDLQTEEGTVARVLLVAPAHGFKPDHERWLALLVEVAGQSLHNSVLLQRVRLLADQAEQASRTKSEFLATMSHEIRTPLHGVLGMAELLHKETEEGPRQDLIETLSASGRQLQRIIDDVLDISRIEAGRLQLLNEPFEIVSLLEQVVDLHATSAAAKGLELRLRISARFPVLAFGDAGRLAQILGNLINNAVKFTAQGSVQLTAEVAADGQLLLAVCDTGPGIAHDQIERLFLPFSQLDSSLTRAHSGSGLGLAICRRLAEGMGATLGLRASPGPGSCFELRLPVGKPQSPPLLTSLLADVNLVALVDAPTYRVLLRLARRWGFRLKDARHLSARPDRLVLFDNRDPEMRARAALWAQARSTLLQLHSPLSSTRSEGEIELPATAVRWPLIESRLLAALLDRVV